MCGLAGIFIPTDQLQDQLQLMASRLRHRGPDDVGYYINDKIGLAHTRLSIVAPYNGHQPVSNEDDSIWLSCNGEIFNYRSLKSDLVKQGHRFNTESDCEVILHLYEQYGIKCLDMLNGQFAFALWDTQKQCLLLARDRAGILPLFYHRTSQGLIFASEIKALLPIIKEAPRLNPSALDQIFTFWSPVGTQTLFSGIEQLEPGHFLQATTDGIKVEQYWDWTFPRNGEHLGDNRDNIDQLKNILDDSVNIRLNADVPVGAYLSGGLDSTALVSSITDQTSNPLHSFSVGFGDKSQFDESYYQLLASEHFSTVHHHIECSESDIADQFIQTILATETPILRTAPSPLQQLSKLAREQNIPVVLTGEGADEVLGGYDIFKETKIRRFWAKNANSNRRASLLLRLYPYMEQQITRSPSYMKHFFGHMLEQTEHPFYSHALRWQTTSSCKQFFSQAMQDAIKTDALSQFEQSLPSEFSHWHWFNQAQYLEAKTLLPGYILSSQGDRMLLSNSIEGRFPFLDHRLIEYANQLPHIQKMRALNEKWILKKAYSKKIPAKIAQRHKQPYRAPESQVFFQNGEHHLVSSLMSEEMVKRYDYFDAKKVSMLVNKARHGKLISQRDNMAFIGILSTQLWHSLFIEGYNH